MIAPTVQEIALGPFRVNLAEGRLFRNGVTRDLRPQAFRVLRLLMERSGQFVAYEQMIRAAWDVNVSKHTVATTVNELKNVLEECGSWIVCRPKVGYSLEVPKSRDLLRRGWHFWNQYTRAGFENALRCFELASKEDPEDFQAFQGIASTYLMLAGFLMLAPRGLHRAFLEAQSRAIALCGLTPELRLDRAFGLFIFEQKLAEAEAELLALQCEKSTSVHLYIRLALIYLASGRLDEAQAMMLEAAAEDALAPELGFLTILVRIFRREFAAAVEWGQGNLALHPGAQVGRALYADALDRAGYPEEALHQFRTASTLAPDIPWIRVAEARCLAVQGRRDEALAILQEMSLRRDTEYVDAYYVAVLWEALGEHDQAFHELERACQERSHMLLFTAVDPKADGLKADSRFVGLRNRMLGAAG